MTFFEVGKYYRTRSGFRARVVCTDKAGKYPLVVLVADETFQKKSEELVLTYRADGAYPNHTSYDLMEEWQEPREPIVIDMWAVVFDNGARLYCNTKELADTHIGRERFVACIHITGKEGVD